jgi:hypothetical protein
MSERRRFLTEDQIAAASGTPGLDRTQAVADDPNLDPDLLDTAIAAM